MKKLTKDYLKELILEEISALREWPESPIYKGRRDESHLFEEDEEDEENE